MNPVPESRADGGAAREGGDAPPARLIDEFSNTLGSMRAQLGRFLALVALEAQRAGLTLVAMIAMGLAAAFCAFGAWLGILTALAIWAVSVGFRPMAVAIVFASLNLLGATVLGYACLALSRALLFSATRRQVAGPSSPTPPEG